MDHALVLFGTSEPAAPARVLAAGALTATLEAGSLRHIRLGGHEALRAIACVVRDCEWGTCASAISDLSIRAEADRFLVTYLAECRSADRIYRYEASIEGTPSRLLFRMHGEAVTDFPTARLGFVVLHPASLSACPVEVQHTDGWLERAAFPGGIEPYQPFMDIRAIAHEPAPGLRVTCRMEGDTFEMEDQRNWTDASFKTYARPIGRPWPYLIRAGETCEQSVELTSAGVAAAGAAGAGPARIALGELAGALPALGLRLDADVTLAAAEIALLRALGPAHLWLRFDPRQHDAATLRRQRETVAAIGAPLFLATVLPGAAPEREAEAIAAAVRQAAMPVAMVLAVPAPDLKATLPGSPWPACPPLEQVYRAMRRAFPTLPLGGGSYGCFAELNRKRPPVALLDRVTFATSPIVHAADDVTVMENLATLPAIFASAAGIAAGRPLLVGPSQIGFGDNPYGAAPVANPANVRTPMTDRDPRQRGLFAAAWAVGYLARCAAAAVEAVTLCSPVGGSGIIHRGDRPPARAQGQVYPIYHVLRLIAGAAGARTLHVASSDPGRVMALAWCEADRVMVLAANLTASTETIVLEGLDGLNSAGALDVTSCQTAAGDPGFFDHMSHHAAAHVLELGPYGVHRFVGEARRGLCPRPAKGRRPLETI